MGLNHQTGEPMDPQMEGIFDNYSVKRQIINSGYVKTFYLYVFHNYLHSPHFLLFILQLLAYLSTVNFLHAIMMHV